MRCWKDMNGSKLNYKKKDLYKNNMKGLIIKQGDEICKAYIPHSGVSLLASITRYNGVSWSIGGLRMPEKIHVTWNGGMLKVGDEIEVEFVEFNEADETTPPAAEESHSSLMETVLAHVDDNPEIWNRKLETYYRLKKILEDENVIEVTIRE